MNGQVRTLDVAAAWIRRVDAEPELRLSIPRVPFTDRAARRAIRRWVNNMAAQYATVPTIDRMTRSGAPTRRMGWLAWL